MYMYANTVCILLRCKQSKHLLYTHDIVRSTFEHLPCMAYIHEPLKIVMNIDYLKFEFGDRSA